jgi:hypothetical protein
VPDVKNIVFTFIAIIVIPLLFFVLVELSLTVFGVGTSFAYFQEIDIDGQPHYQENPDFADQFYAPSLNIGPRENTFTVARSPDLIRVYVLGGSAAMGFPHRNHGLDRLLATQLRAAFPRRKVEVINTAMTSVNSHVVYAVAQSIPDNSADFAVILMGNNEVVGPYGPGTLNQNFLTNISVIRGLQALKRTRIWQALDRLIKQVRPSDALQDLEWEGMQMFSNQGVAHDDPRMESVYGHYDDNLKDIIETLRSKGIHVLLSSVPVNLRHSAPFLSVHGPNLSEEQLDQWRELDSLGTQSFDQENWGDASQHFQAALEIDPGFAAWIWTRCDFAPIPGSGGSFRTWPPAFRITHSLLWIAPLRSSKPANPFNRAGTCFSSTFIMILRVTISWRQRYPARSSAIWPHQVITNRCPAPK